MPTSAKLLHSLIYLDRGYIADLYEVVTGDSSKTTVTKNQGKKAGAQIPVFSAEVSAQETRSFSISTFQMLAKTMAVLDEHRPLDPSQFKAGMTSLSGWVEGELTAFRANSTVQRSSGVTETLSSTSHFQLRNPPALDLALITVPEYFSYGLDALLKMQETILGDLAIPVRAFVRVIAAQSHIGQWVATPLLMLERNVDG
jgi:hypothetical protein